MNQAIKNKWIAALRSRKYKQGRFSLHSKDKFCVLGVLCDLHSKAWGYSWETNTYHDSRYLGKGVSLPESVRQWAGLSEIFPIVEGVDLHIHNDGRDGNPKKKIKSVRPKGFKRLATLIDKYL